jgi:5-methylcytosine-specific restriction enzyme subunit McrC
MKIIRVFEYSRLSVNEQGFTRPHFELLVRYNEQHGNKYFTVGNGRIYFKNYVGVIQAGNITIEILPKADNTTTETTAEINRWHNALIFMLNMAGYINIESISRAELQLQSVTLIDIFYKVFLVEVRSIIHNGLIKSYRYKSDNLPYLKGRLVFNRHLSENYLHKEMFYTTHQVYDKNNNFNQILYQALLVLKTINKNNALHGEVCNILLHFDELEIIPINDKLFDSLKYNRNTERYKTAIILAKLILQNYSPSLNFGDNSIIGILFDMNILFEKVIYKLLKGHETIFSNRKLILFAQQRKEFWRGKTIRPDIIGEYQCERNTTRTKFIIDTKWKRPADSLPNDGDLKQMFTYNIHFGAKKSILLYPWVAYTQAKSARFNESEAVDAKYLDHSCSTQFIDIFAEDGSINRFAGIEIIRLIMEESNDMRL